MERRGEPSRASEGGRAVTAAAAPTDAPWQAPLQAPWQARPGRLVSDAPWQASDAALLPCSAVEQFHRLVSLSPALVAPAMSEAAPRG